MDLNSLLFHHQIALIRAKGPVRPSNAAGSPCELVRHYGKRIIKLRGEMGVTQYAAGHDCAGSIAA